MAANKTVGLKQLRKLVANAQTKCDAARERFVASSKVLYMFRDLMEGLVPPYFEALFPGFPFAPVRFLPRTQTTEVEW